MGTRANTRGALIGLAAGLGLGMVLHAHEGSWWHAVAEVVEPVGMVWAQALQVVVLPLVLVLLFATVVADHGEAPVGRMGLTALGVFIGLLALAGSFTLTVGPLLLQAVGPDAATFVSLSPAGSAAAEAGASAASIPGSAPTTGAEWWASLLPGNVLRALLDGQLLPLILLVLLLGLGARCFAPHRRRFLATGSAALRDALLALVNLILWAMPYGVFALALGFARRSGADLAGTLAEFVVMVSALLIGGTLLLYAVAVLIGGVPLVRFARAVRPAQVVAVGTRSSLATLPSLVQAARDDLHLSEPVVGFGLPFAASLFKVNRMISSPFHLLFLASMYGLELTLIDTATFVATVVLLSFATLGIPSGGGGFKTLPLYVSMGIPVEGYLLIRTLDVIPDIFKTVVNTTGFLTAATVLERLTGAGRKRTTSPAADLPG